MELWVTAIATALLFVVTLVYVVLTGFTLREVRRQAKAAQGQLKTLKDIEAARADRAIQGMLAELHMNADLAVLKTPTAFLDALYTEGVWALDKAPLGPQVREAIRDAYLHVATVNAIIRAAPAMLQGTATTNLHRVWEDARKGIPGLVRTVDAAVGVSGSGRPPAGEARME